VWVYDLQSHRRVRKISLQRPVDAIMTTQDDKPLLFAQMQSAPPLTFGYVQVYSVSSGKLLGTVEPNLAIFEHIYGM